MAARCAAVTRAGNPCPSPVVAGSAYCWTHDPSLAEARREAGIKGGKARSNRARAAKALPDGMGPEEVVRRLSGLYEDVVAGRADPKLAQAANAVARTLLGAWEVRELERRIAALEGKEAER